MLEWAQLKHSGYTAEEVNFVISLLATHSVKYQPGGGAEGREGRAMFPTFAFMSHSCDYNARHVIQPSGRMQVFAQKKISAGEEITITYTGLLTSQPAKQEKLANVWFFTCTCPRCSDPTELGITDSDKKFLRSLQVCLPAVIGVLLTQDGQLKAFQLRRMWSQM